MQGIYRVYFVYTYKYIIFLPLLAVGCLVLALVVAAVTGNVRFAHGFALQILKILTQCGHFSFRSAKDEAMAINWPTRPIAARTTSATTAHRRCSTAAADCCTTSSWVFATGLLPSSVDRS